MRDEACATRFDLAADDRRSAAVRARADASYRLGVDIGGTCAKVGLFFDGELLEHTMFPTGREGLAHESLDAAFAKLISRRSLDTSAIGSIGLALPGMVSSDQKLSLSPNLDIDLDDLLEKLRRLWPDTSICVGNDAEAALIAEMLFGAARGVDDVALVVIGTGLGAGIASGGRLVKGRRGASGEIGHLKLDTSIQGRPCGCGRRGCAERYLSGTGFAEVVAEHLREGGRGSALADAPQVDARDIFTAAMQGDAFACDEVEAFADRLALVLAQLACVTDPELILIGGGVSLSSEAYLDRVRERFTFWALPVQDDTRIEVASLGNLAGMYGAAYGDLLETV